MMKKIYLLALLTTLGISCNEASDVLEEEFERGGLVVWENVPESFALNFLDIENTSFTHNVLDPNNNIITYDLQMTYKDIVVDKFITITSFPATLHISGQAVLDALNLTADEFELVPLRFIAFITTTNGIFSGELTNFSLETSSNHGGEAGPELLDHPSFNQAINFSLLFIIPPPEKIRGTSFEEPMVRTGRYTRNGGPLDEVELINTPGEADIMYTSIGTGVDNEIGFRAEFINNNSGDGFLQERIGVTDYTVDVGVFLDGSQGYRLEDADGIIKLTFDRVSIPENVINSGVQIQFYIPDLDNDMEDEDGLNIYVLIERTGGVTETMELFSENGLFLNLIRDKWELIDTGFLSDVTAYTLFIEHNTNNNAERIYFDQMLVYKIKE